MKSTRSLAWLAVFLNTVFAGPVAKASGDQPVELNIQMVPGIWVTGANGKVSIEYTTNPDQTGGWALLANVQATNSPYFYIDASATNSTKRFYRAVVENRGNTNEPAANPDSAHLVWINAGTFLMGSPTNEVEREDNEGPQTRVTLSQGFWMSKHETSQEEYLAVMGNNPSYFTGDLTRPVEQVSWSDATNYCGKLTVRERAAGRLPTGYVYRLPTEAEWEYACRAGTTTRFSYGEDSGYTQLGIYAWYRDNSYTTVKPSGVSYEDGGRYYTTHSVGQKQASAWGLYDMYGNVLEWCLDWKGKYPGGNVTDPQGPTLGSNRVFRGGAWVYYGRYCRSAFRYDYRPDGGIDSLGFRSVLAPGQ